MLSIPLVFMTFVGIFIAQDRKHFIEARYLDTLWEKIECWIGALLISSARSSILVGTIYILQKLNMMLRFIHG